MSDQDQSAHNAEETPTSSVDKGKGKAVEPSHDMSLDEDEESSEEESGAEDQGGEEAEEEDGMEEIDTANIVSDGRRTRGKAIDFAKAAEEEPAEEDEDDDDDDFEDPEERDPDRMEE